MLLFFLRGRQWLGKHLHIGYNFCVKKIGENHMKVLLVNGSPKADGCVGRALQEMVSVFQEEGVETTVLHVGNKDIRGCIACGRCGELGKCVFDDAVNEAAKLFEEADGVVFGSPVYYGSVNGTMLSFLDRLFYSTPFSKRMKVGAAVTSCRRGGNTATFDILNKYFTISEMPVASSHYWNMVHGFTAEDVEKDLEGLQTMRTLARNMSFLITEEYYFTEVLTNKKVVSFLFPVGEESYMVSYDG